MLLYLLESIWFCIKSSIIGVMYLQHMWFFVSPDCDCVLSHVGIFDIHCYIGVMTSYAMYVYVVIHLCDSMWSFCVEANLCRVFIVFIGDPISRGEYWDRIDRFNSIRLLYLSQEVSIGIALTGLTQSDCYTCHKRWVLGSHWPILLNQIAIPVTSQNLDF